MNMNKPDSQDSFSIQLKHLKWTAAAIVTLWVLSGVAIYNWAPDGNYGTFGDMFGAINSLFSGLAFACLIFATLMQREELRLQRKELQLARQESAATREEIRGQKEQAIAQNATLAQQTFDNTFFQLLRLHNDIINSIDLRDNNNNISSQGRDCFKVFYERFKKRWGKSLPQDSGSTELQRINETYRNFYRDIEADAGHYFRSLYNIIKFIDLSSTSDKRVYTNLVRAQLSSYELLLLFYNCLSNLGNQKFLPLVERYALLKMLPFEHLLDATGQKSLYADSAYTGSTVANSQSLND
jgi:hypothetical protein